MAELKVGMRVKIKDTGIIRDVSCTRTCFDCMKRESEKVFTIKEIYSKEKLGHDRTIWAIIDNGQCRTGCKFHPDDLEVEKITSWKKRLTNE